MDLASASRDTCCDVEEGEPETLAPTGRERLGQRENPDPAGDVVGERRGEPPAPVAEEALQRSVVQPEVRFQVDDRLQHIQAALPADVRLTSRRHPLVGKLVRVESAHRWNGNIWLVVMLPDGHPGRVRVEETELSGADPLGEMATGTLSLEGLRSLRAHVARLKDRLAADAS